MMDITVSQQLGRRIFWLSIGSSLLIATYFIVWNYFTFLKQSENDMLHRLQGIANAIAIQIDPEKHQYLIEHYQKTDAIKNAHDDTIYNELHKLLARNLEANMLKTPIYTMIKADSLKENFEFIVTSDETPYFRHPYSASHNELKENYDNGSVIHRYTDKYGVWLSAFAPIKNKYSKTIAVVQVDEKFDTFLALANKNAFQNIGIALILIFPLLIILFILLQRLIARENRYQNELNNAYQENLAMQQQIEASYKQLSSLDNLRKEMLANISHDLRTPLANLSGYIETLSIKQENINPEDRKKYLLIAQKETERLRLLINDVFELSKLEAKQIKADIIPFSIAELLQDILFKNQKIIQESHIVINHNISDNIPYVHGDIGLLERVIQNLLENAIKYNEIGGSIDVNLLLNNQENKLEFNISNTGDEIPADILPNIFDRYYKFPRDANQSSTGLGLAIVKKIIELHHSEIIVSSKNGKTSFIFSLPIYQQATEA